jgi:hypothetical protein
VSCDSLASRAGESRFPLGAWDRAGVHGWLVAGSPACAEDLFRGLRRPPRRGTVALSLEASEAHDRPPVGVRLVTAATGVVPLALADPDDPRVSDVRAMVARTGAPAAWWAALGHDAAILARAAVASLPLDTTAEADAIARRRAIVRQGLVDARAMLWTSEHDGFDATQSLPRTIRVTDLGR